MVDLCSRLRLSGSCESAVGVKRALYPQLYQELKITGVLYSLFSNLIYKPVFNCEFCFQIDNQQIGTVFPVALYPSPLPSYVIQRSGT